MLGVYYAQSYDSRALFKGMKIEQSDSFEKHLNMYHVIYIDFSQYLDEYRNYRDYIESILNNLKEDLFKAYPSLTEKFGNEIYRLFHQTNDQFIFLLNHYVLSGFCNITG